MKSRAYTLVAAPLGALLMLGVGAVQADDCDAVVTPADPAGAIQAAIDAASPGDTVCVEDGTYTEDLDITTDGLTLRGEGENTVIMGVSTVASGSFPLAGSAGAPLGNLNIDANDVTVEKLTLMLASGGATAYSAGVTVNGTNVTLERNHFVAPGGTPGTVVIQTWFDPSPSTGDISGLRIAKNRFSGAAGDGFGYEGIFVNPQQEAVDPDNPVVIAKNKFSGDMYRAIGVARASVVVEKNKMETDLAGAPIATSDFGDVPWGIKVWDDAVVEKNKATDEGAGVFNVGLALAGGSGTAAKNDVRGAATTGVDVDSGGTWALVKNKARDGAGDGFDISTSGHTLTKNEAEDNAGDGFVLSATASGNTLTKNEAEDNAGFGIVDAGSGNTYTKNKCEDNGAGASSPAGLC